MLIFRKRLMIGISILTVAVMISLSACTGSGDSNYSVQLDSYTPICIENSDYSLAVDENGVFYLANKKTATVLKSVPDLENEEFNIIAKNQILSALNIKCYYSDTGGTIEAFSYPSAVLTDGLTIKKAENEIIAEYYFATEQITIPVHYTLDGSMVKVTILPEEIEEKGSGRLTEISIHPYFGSGSGTDEGILFVPDGSGAIVEFNQIVSSEYKQKIYSRDHSLYSFTSPEKTEPSVMTAFGSCIKQKGSYLGIITMGAADAAISAIPGSDMVGFNAVYPSFTVMSKDIRDYPDDHRLSVDILPDSMKDTGPLQVAYSFTEDENPNYMLLANSYRDYLIERYGLTRLQSDDYPISMDITMSTIKTKTFLGIPYEGIMTLTTTAEAEEIISFFANKNISTIVRLNNWSKQTVKETPADDCSFISGVGTKRDYDRLFDTAINNGQIYLNGNLSQVSGGGVIKRSTEYAKSLQKTAVEYQQYNLVSGFREDGKKYFLSNASVLKYADILKKSLKNLNATVKLSFDDANLLYTDFSAEKSSLSATEQTFSTALDKFSAYDIAVSYGAEYTLSAAKYIFNIPCADSGYDCISYSVPFYQIVLHGYVPFSSEAINTSANPQYAYLKAIESGALLHFDFVYSSASDVRYSDDADLHNASFELWRDISVEKYKEAYDVGQKSQTQLIVNHTRLTDGVFLTEYEDGSNIVVNYNDSDYVYCGQIVKAMSWLEVKGVA